MPKNHARKKELADLKETFGGYVREKGRHLYPASGVTPGSRLMTNVDEFGSHCGLPRGAELACVSVSRLARPQTMEDAGMGEQWATLAAAGIGMVGGVLSTLGGSIVGRRQTTDQARIEHGQWLRGQRQEAYVALLDAWDTCVKRFQEIADDIEVQVYRHRIQTSEYDVEEEISLEIWSRTDAISEPAQRAIERVELLGPKDVDETCTRLVVALKTLGEATCAKAGTENWPDSTAREKAWEQAGAARAGFLAASRSAMQTAPAPGRRRS